MLVYKANIDGTQSSLLVDNGVDMQYYSPNYSKDGKKVVFLGSKGGNANSAVLVCNIYGSNLERLTTDTALTTEAIFSLNGDTAYLRKPVSIKIIPPLQARHHTSLIFTKSF